MNLNAVARIPHRIGAGHTDQVQPDADGNAKSHVDEKQHREVAADPRVGVFQHLSGHGHVAFSNQVDESIAQILAPDQEEHHEHDDDADCAQRFEQCAEHATKDLQRARRRGKNADREGQFGGP